MDIWRRAFQAEGTARAEALGTREEGSVAGAEDAGVGDSNR